MPLKPYCNECANDSANFHIFSVIAKIDFKIPFQNINVNFYILTLHLHFPYSQLNYNIAKKIDFNAKLA